MGSMLLRSVQGPCEVRHRWNCCVRCRSTRNPKHRYETRCGVQIHHRWKRCSQCSITKKGLKVFSILKPLLPGHELAAWRMCLLIS